MENSDKVIELQPNDRVSLPAELLVALIGMCEAASHQTSYKAVNGLLKSVRENMEVVKEKK
jgi:hypothetical protein